MGGVCPPFINSLDSIVSHSSFTDHTFHHYNPFPFACSRASPHFFLLIPSLCIHLPPSMASLFLLSLSLHSSNWNRQLQESWHTPATGSWLERNYMRERKRGDRQRKYGKTEILPFRCFIVQRWERVPWDESLALLYLHVILWQTEI